MTPELVVDNVTKTYPNGVQALKGVSLRIPAGMFGLLGPNRPAGMGKEDTFNPLNAVGLGLGAVAAAKPRGLAWKLRVRSVVTGGYLGPGVETVPGFPAQQSRREIPVD